MANFRKVHCFDRIPKQLIGRGSGKHLATMTLLLPYICHYLISLTSHYFKMMPSQANIQSIIHKIPMYV